MSPQVKEVDRSAGRRYLGTAEEFLRAAMAAFAREDWNAAGLAAIHAGISSTDAYLAWSHGVRNTSRDHLESAALLESLGGAEVAERVKALRRLVKRKTVVEYDDRHFTGQLARDALTRAERLVAWARDTVRG